MNIRKTKKAIKNSNGFLTILCKNNYVFCGKEEYEYFFTREAVVVTYRDLAYCYIPYKVIKRVIINTSPLNTNIIA